MDFPKSLVHKFDGNDPRASKVISLSSTNSHGERSTCIEKKDVPAEP